MDDKKKIIFLSIAVVVAIGLIVLIVVTKRGGEIAGPTGLPSAPPFTTPGTPTGTGQPVQPGWAENLPGVASSAAPNAFIPKQLAGENSGFTRTAGGVYVAPGTPQPTGYVPTPINVSDSYLISQITSSSISDLQKGLDASIFTTSTILKMASDYLKNLSNLPTDPDKLQTILNNISSTMGAFLSPQQMAQQFLNSVTGTNATNILGSLSGIQGITADQISYLQSLVAATSTIPSLNQGLLSLGMQNQDFISNFLANATGTVSVAQLRALLQQFNMDSSMQCDQIMQQLQPIKNMEALTSGGFGLDAMWQYLPMQNCATSTSTSGANG